MYSSRAKYNTINSRANVMSADLARIGTLAAVVCVAHSTAPKIKSTANGLEFSAGHFSFNCPTVPTGDEIACEGVSVISQGGACLPTPAISAAASENKECQAKLTKIEGDLNDTIAAKDACEVRNSAIGGSSRPSAHDTAWFYTYPNELYITGFPGTFVVTGKGFTTGSPALYKVYSFIEISLCFK